MKQELYSALHALCSMFSQYCGGEWGHMFMSAGERATEVLEEYELIKNPSAVGGEIDWERLEKYRVDNNLIDTF